MKCPSCNKFAAQDCSGEPEVELDVAEVTPEGVVINGTAHIAIMSECCGDELKTADFDIDLTLEFEVDENNKTKRECTCTEFTVEMDSSEITEDYDTTKTKTLKDGTVRVKHIPARFQTHYYGVTVEMTATCECSKTVVSGTFEDKIPSSSMDEC